MDGIIKALLSLLKFQKIQHFGGICYEINVNGFKDSIPFKKAKDAGLTFWMDCNFEK